MAKKLNDMPHSLEAEQALLGCLLMDTRIQVEIAPFIKEDDFYSESHRIIFSVMNDLINKNQPVDLVTLTDALEKRGSLEQAGGIEYITNLTSIMPSTANVNNYLDIVQRDGTFRKLIDGSSKIIKECCSGTEKGEVLAFAEKTVYDISEQTDNGSVVKINDVIPSVMVKLDELSKNKSDVMGIKTGYKGIDKLLNGLHPSDLIILAARPAVGKTSFAMNILENVALQGYSCAVFSLEMSKEQLVQRMMCSVANVSMENALKGKLDRREWLKIAKARESLSTTKIFIDDTSMITPQEVLSKCRRLKRKYGLNLVVIDYIQLMSSENSKKSDNRQQEISEISRWLKLLAKEIGVTVIALSQLSRAVETRRGRPQLSDLRESGAIEQDADIVAFIHRPDRNATEQEIQKNNIRKNVAEILVEKHRNGPTGLVKLYFKGECTKFINYNEETGENEEEENSAKENPEVKGYEDLPEDCKETENSSEESSFSEVVNKEGEDPVF